MLAEAVYRCRCLSIDLIAPGVCNLLSVFLDYRVADRFDPVVTRSMQDLSTMRHAFLLTAGVSSPLRSLAPRPCWRRAPLEPRRCTRRASRPAPAKPNWSTTTSSFACIEPKRPAASSDTRIPQRIRMLLRRTDSLSLPGQWTAWKSALMALETDHASIKNAA